MEKIIMFIASMDTKQEEINYAASIARSHGCSTMILDTSTKDYHSQLGDVSPLEILDYNGIKEADFEKMNKGLRIETMAQSVITYTKKLYIEKKFTGVMSIGGGQNSKMSSNAMKELPYGVPKIIVSTLASGNRIFDTYMGNKDILIMHSVVDIAGLNSITRMIINNSVAAMVGMVEHAIRLTSEKDRPRVAATMLGITSKGASAIMGHLESAGCETVGFHANGVGGVCMEKLMEEAYFDLILDMNLHEITCEFLGGFCTGAYRRLEEAAKRGVTQIVVPGAIDVLDFGVTLETRENIMKEVKERQYYFHNSGIIHSKITKKEAEKLAGVVAGRLNQAIGSLKVILPLGGFCEAGAKGKELYNKETDETFIKVLKEKLSPRIIIMEVDANINDQEFIDVVRTEAKKYLSEKLLGRLA